MVDTLDKFENLSDLGLDLKRPVLVGLFVVILFIGSFGGWAGLAPLDSAAIAEGIIVVDSKRKTVQHLEGGIVSKILVREGDEVSAGDPLIVLDKTRPNTNLERARGQRLRARALEARLIAEREGSNSIAFPVDLGAAAGDLVVTEIVSGQQNIFQARKKSIEGQTAILKQQIAQLRSESHGVTDQKEKQDEQITLLEDEVRSVANMYQKGLVGKSRLRQLQREIVDLQGQRSKNQATLSRIQQNISEARLKISELNTNLLNEVVQELRDVQAEIRDLSEQILAYEDVLVRTDIKAPISGVIVGLQVSTVGGVIGPGEPLLDIVPKGERLIIEARVDPTDIDDVRAGMDAQVQITSFNQRSVKPSPGVVMTVSADHLMDERSGLSYFLARIALTEDALKALKDKRITPGMPVQVMIVTGARTPIEYLIKPITDSLNRAMRET